MIRAVLITAAVGLSCSMATYAKGRVDGWDRRDEAQKISDLGALASRFDAFETSLAANTAQGDALDTIRATVRDEMQGLPDAIADIFVCPVDPGRLRVIRANTDAANRALDRAAGRPPDDATGSPDAATGPGDQH
ncbi:hypothetical protein [Maricaulis sp.]|uniref:hypothetical protein n=1 Tax=Maricaulis sp. TaxID=1486257 RepID=UPI003A91FADA